MKPSGEQPRADDLHRPAPEADATTRRGPTSFDDEAGGHGGSDRNRRRRWLVGGVAATAALAGAGIAQWRWSVGATRSAEAAQAEAALWKLRFTAPAGGELAMAGFLGRPLLLNFWATWCAPCLKEMPLLDAFFRQQQTRGWQVVGLAVDSPTPVRQYLARLPIGFPIGLAGMEGAELTRSLGNPTGSLPFSVVFDKQGRVVDRKLGQLGGADLQRWLERVT